MLYGGQEAGVQCTCWSVSTTAPQGRAKMASDKIEIAARVNANLDMITRRRLPVGAEVLPQGGVHFRVWARRCQRVSVILEEDPSPGAAEQTMRLRPEPNGY